MRCIGVLATEIFGKISVASEEMQLTSGWTLIELELSSPNFNSPARAERIHYLIGNLEFCPNY